MIIYKGYEHLNKLSATPDEELEIELNSILKQSPPDVLFHYTTRAGLLGIVNERAIWATHTQYLNDRSEYSHALDLAKNEINMRINSVTEVHVAEIYRNMAVHLDEIQKINICVVSFSEVNDLLSQWRAYGDQASGFAIGFTYKFLFDAAEQEKCSIVPCLYNGRDQRRLISLIVETALREHLEDSENEVVSKYDELDPILWPAQTLGRYLDKYALILKHKKFEEEKEWRIITQPIPIYNQRLEFREGRSMIIPYYPFPLEGPAGYLRVQEVVVGPTPNMDISVYSVDAFLHSRANVFGDKLVTESEVPYRNW